MKNKILFDQYIMYGLNRNRRFLRLPRGERLLTLRTSEDIEEFSKEILKGKDCECALFYVHLDGTYSSIFKSVLNQELTEAETLEDSQMVVTYSICKSPRKADTHLFSWLDGEFRFCCYSLLIEKKDGVFEVCR